MQFVVEIPNVRADFGLSVLKTLSFVKKATPVSKKENAIIEDLEISAKEVRSHRQGRIKLKTARELLDEL
ncbi:MAG: hypothetical protein FWF51_13280 [Chitinivibrionia bacterium]|nr:hypothetical protein [Chitinivibrionia bacterium]